MCVCVCVCVCVCEFTCVVCVSVWYVCVHVAFVYTLTNLCTIFVNSPHSIHTLSNLAKHAVFAIQPVIHETM